MTLTANERRHFQAGSACHLCGHRKPMAVALVFPAAEYGIFKMRFRWPQRRTFGWLCPECGEMVITYQQVTREVICP